MQEGSKGDETMLRRFGGEGSGAMTGWQRQRPPTETVLNENRDDGRSIVRRLWRRVRRDGAQIEATLWFNNSLGQACVEIEVCCAHAGDLLAENLARDVLVGLDAEGATEPGE